MKELSKDELLEILDEWLRITIDAYLLDEDEISVGEDKQAQKQIRKLIEEKPKVTRGFVEKWLERIYCDRKSIRAIRNNLEELFEEAGVEIIGEKE